MASELERMGVRFLVQFGIAPVSSKRLKDPCFIKCHDGPRPQGCLIKGEDIGDGVRLKGEKYGQFQNRNVIWPALSIPD